MHPKPPSERSIRYPLSLTKESVAVAMSDISDMADDLWWLFCNRGDIFGIWTGETGPKSRLAFLLFHTILH